MKNIRGLLAAAAVGLVASLAWTGVQAADVGVAKGDTSAKRIALSNSYAGNSWRQAMLKAWNGATADAIKAGLIKEVKVVNANNSASEQASQIQSLIVEGWDAIVIDAGSTTALNGVIQEACDAHIAVIADELDDALRVLVLGDDGARLRRHRRGLLQAHARRQFNGQL